MIRAALIAAACAGLATATPVPAQTSSATIPMGQTQKGPSQAGISFMKQAAEGNLAEIRMGELAQQRGSSQAVRQYGAALVNDYTKAQKRLKDLAGQEGVQLPDKPNPQQQNTYNRLKALSGSKFDQEFLKAQTQAHQRELAQFQGEAQAGKDPNVARYAERSVPALQMHLQMAQDAGKQVAAGQPPSPPSGKGE